MRFGCETRAGSGRRMAGSRFLLHDRVQAFEFSAGESQELPTRYVYTCATSTGTKGAEFITILAAPVRVVV